jgi:hypothetical protein
MLRKALVASKHKHRGDGGNVTITDARGNSRSYTLTRLQQHRPALRAAPAAKQASLVLFDW